MAIDDNTSYELTGAQVKDLANKIKGKAADNTFVGATPAAPGSKGLVPGPQAGDNTKFLSGNGTWQTVPTVNNGALTIQQNGKTLCTFTANSSDDKTVNIQAITADTVGAITTNMIADGAVTASKVDWSSMTSAYAHASTNTSIQYPISFGNFLTVTVPQTGTYRIESMVHAATNELSQIWYARTRITVNGSVPSTFDPYVEALIAGKTDYYACATISNNGVVSLTQGDVVALQLQSLKNDSRCTLKYADLFIQRIS